MCRQPLFWNRRSLAAPNQRRLHGRQQREVGLLFSNQKIALIAPVTLSWAIQIDAKNFQNNRPVPTLDVVRSDSKCWCI
jgi:hypothetical protein